MRILANESIGLIIDMQERLYPHIHQHEALTRTTGILIEGLKALNIKLMVTEQYTKGLGFTIQPLKSLIQDIPVIEKQAFSCCDDDLFNKDFAAISPKNVIIAGIETHVCVLQTTIDLLQQGYQPVVIEDCVGSRKPNDKAIAIERMKQEGAIISTSESILFELLRYSGTETFKKVSKLVK